MYLSGFFCKGHFVFLFVCFVYSRLSNFSAIRRLSPLPVTGLQIQAYARRSEPLSREGSLSCHTCCDTGPRFIRSHPKDRNLRPKVEFEPWTQGSSDHCARRSNHCATLAAPYFKIDQRIAHQRNCIIIIVQSKAINTIDNAVFNNADILYTCASCT